MKKMKIKQLPIIIPIIVVIIISGISIVYAETYAANAISYNKNGQSTVEGALNDLYKGYNYSKLQQVSIKHGMRSGEYVPETCKTPTLNEGDYVTIVPSTSELRWTSEESPTGSVIYLHPNELTLWRVIKKNSCNVEVVSEYVSSNTLCFAGEKGFKNFVGALNTIAAAYENPTYTVGSRMMGYDGQTEVLSDTSIYNGSTDVAPSTLTTSSPTSGTGSETGGGVRGDTLYLKDYQLVSNVYKSDTTTYGSNGLIAYKVGTTTKAAYLLASRKYTYSSATFYYFSGRTIVSSGNFGSPSYRSFDSYWRDSSNCSTVRPILVLKTGVKASGIAGENGTKAHPYTLIVE